MQVDIQKLFGKGLISEVFEYSHVEKMVEIIQTHHIRLLSRTPLQEQPAFGCLPASGSHS